MKTPDQFKRGGTLRPLDPNVAKQASIADLSLFLLSSRQSCRRQRPAMQALSPALHRPVPKVSLQVRTVLLGEHRKVWGSCGIWSVMASLGHGRVTGHRMNTTSETSMAAKFPHTLRCSPRRRRAYHTHGRPHLSRMREDSGSHTRTGVRFLRAGSLSQPNSHSRWQRGH